jgi:hypothetical protein
VVNTPPACSVLNGRCIFNIKIDQPNVHCTVYLYVCVRPTDISQYRLRFGFSLLYKDRVPFELLDSAALLHTKGDLRWRGANSISKFDHHNR